MRVGEAVVVRCELGCAPDSPRRARDLVRSGLTGVLSPALVADIVLLVSELVTNAVVHARTPVELVVAATAGVVRAEVCDRGHGSRPAAIPADPMDEGGRGLWLVETLAREWGWRRRPDAGCCVWFEVASDPSADQGVTEI